ncbi:phage protease [Plastoroseomonas hellenica]|uniref:phage protease n=1 Tax=Plastoroseomonas hellenica TaxID=2687306 RepID=UPI001BA730A1|nr:phage protease [Plastoroseomonas hellenica]MBR0643995.1 hypothetical protein [Plastoroseomonas hellenica]
MHLLAALHVALPAPAVAGAAAPEWIQLIPAGEFRGADGRGPYFLKDAAAVMAASLPAGARLPIDENHAIDLAAKSGGAAPARGWIVELQARDDGIWGRVEWTGAGRALLDDKAYRGISPVFLHTKDGVVVTLLRAALTNDPNLTQLATLHHQQQQEPCVDLARMRQALGLAADADETAILAAIAANRTAVTAHAQQRSALATTLGIANPAQATDDQVAAALQARIADGGEAATLRATVTALQTQVTTLQQTAAHERAVAAVDAAIGAGKPIPATMRDHYIARHAREPEAVNAELAAMPSINAGGLAGRNLPSATGAGADGLTPDERNVVALLGIDPEAFKKTKVAQEQQLVGGF